MKNLCLYISLLATIHVYDWADAIRCYRCTGFSEDCEATPNVQNCDESQPFCLVASDPIEGQVQQECAAASECPRNANFRKVTDGGKIEVYCCSTIGCNCVGLQCSSGVITASGLPVISKTASSTLLLSTFLMAALLQN